MKAGQWLALLVLAALWGSSFLFIRIASPVLGPFLTIESRVAIAALALLLYLRLTGKTAEMRKHWKQYLVIGALNAAVPFTLIATAALHLTASLSAVLKSLTPVFTAIAAWTWMNERMSGKKWAGVLMGSLGVGILVGWHGASYTPEMLTAVGLALLATVSYGYAGVYVKRKFAGVSPFSLAAGQQLGAAIVLLPFTAVGSDVHPASITHTVVWSVIGLAILCTSLAYILYFYLIEAVGPTKTLSVTFLVPVFGIFWGVLFLNETLEWTMVVGLAVILGSVFLISDVPVRVG